MEKKASVIALGSQAAVFGIIGVANNVLLYLVYLLLTSLDVDILIAMTTVFFAGFLLSWLLNAKLTFKQPLTQESAKRMVVAYSLAYFINSLFLSVSHFVLQLPHEAAQGIIMLILSIFLFFAQRYWVFRHG